MSIVIDDSPFLFLSLSPSLSLFLSLPRSYSVAGMGLMSQWTSGQVPNFRFALAGGKWEFEIFYFYNVFFFFNFSASFLCCCFSFSEEASLCSFHSHVSCLVSHR